MGNKKRPRPVVVSPEEAERVAAAQRLQQQSKQDFESVYGPKAQGSFNPDQDLTAMQSMESMDGDMGFGMKAPQAPPAPPQAPPAQTQPQVPPAAESPQEPAQDLPGEEPQIQLTDDPAENCRKVSEVIGKVVPNPPSPEMLLKWKQLHGDIFVLNIENRIFVYRYLKRQEWVQMNARPEIANMTELQVEDLIFNKCVLWPGMDIAQMASLPANTIGMIVQQIRLQSYFLDPAYVATLTIKI